MFDIIALTLNNFKSYVGKHVFKLPTENGLYLITGANNDNSRLGANGTGKSTLLDAVYWCLYGRTPRGLKASDVISWGKSTCSVTLQIKIGASEYKIYRSQSPNTLTVNDSVVAQEALQKLIRLDQDAFTYAVLLPQFGESFFDLSPAAKLALFSQIMGLDYWLEKSKLANDKATKLLSGRAKMEQVVAKAIGKLEMATVDIDALELQSAQFAANQANIVKRLRGELKEALRIQQKDNENHASIKGILSGIDVKITKFNKEAAKAEETERKLDSSFREYEIRENEIKRELAAFARTNDTLNGLGAACAHCGQKVGKAHIKKELASSILKMECLSEELDQVKEDWTAISKKITAAGLVTGKAEADLKAVETNKRDFERELQKALITMANDKATVTRLTNQIEDEAKRKNPYVEMLEIKRSNIEAFEAEIVAANDAIKAVDEDHAAVSYWVNGFKRLRLFVVEEALQQLEIEVNNNLTSLGLTDWRVRFDVERENKSGGVTKGFTVLVYAPQLKEPVRFEAWSGGETQRLRLAGNLGLANLIMERAGLTSTIEFIDEPSAHLSQEGLLDLAETLNSRALTTNKRILLVDHNIIDYGGFAGVFVVAKDAQGSKVAAT